MTLLVAYAILIAGLLGLSAVLAEKVVSELRMPRRGVWVMSLAGSVSLTGYSAFLGNDTPEASIVSLPFSFDFVPTVVPVQFVTTVTETINSPWPSWPALDNVVMALWAGSSAIAVLICGFAALSLHVAVRRSPTTVLDGLPVVLSDRLGPAIFGFWRPRIVLPRWLADESPSLRALVIDHEREHIDARDHLLLLGGLLLVATMPWNVVLWWQLRRLRAAIEVDCDARVLCNGNDPVGYSEALLAVRQRFSSVPFATVNLTEPVSELERRIGIMMSKGERPSISRAGTRLVLALSLIGLTFAVNTPQAQQTPTTVTGDTEPVVPTIRVSVYEMLSDAQSCLETNDFDCAHERLEEIASMELSNYETALYLNFLAFVEFAEGDILDAVNAYQRLVDLPNLPNRLRRDTLRTLSQLYASSENYQSAFEALEQLLELDNEPSLLTEFDPFGNQEYLPIVRSAPQYPEAALEQELEGYVIVEFTVTTTGSVTDVTVVESSSSIFEAAAVEAAERFKYRPRIESGQPVAFSGIRNRISFVLE